MTRDSRRVRREALPPGLVFSATSPIQRAMEQEQALVRLYAVTPSALLGRALEEVERRQAVLGSRLNALQSVYDDVCAGRMT